MKIFSSFWYNICEKFEYDLIFYIVVNIDIKKYFWVFGFYGCGFCVYVCGWKGIMLYDV